MRSASLIRKATAADGPACAEIVHAWITDTPWMPQGVTFEELQRMLSDGLPKRAAWVIDNPVAGYLSLDPAEDHIWGFYVRRCGAGLGKQLLDHAKTGRQRLQLNTHLPNTRAHAFYAREGFLQVGDPWEGDDGIPEIRLEWHREARAC